MRELYSAVHKIDLSWLRFVLIGFITWRSLGIVENVLWVLLRNDCFLALYILSLIVFLVFVSIMVFKGLKQPEIFSGSVKNHLEKYKKTLLPDELRERYQKKLIVYMETEKPYLQPSLSLDDLAKNVAIPSHHLSQILNSCFGQNFFDFINSYRIEESKRLLGQKRSAQKTILEILYATGFNSKSVFNTAFKKYTGMTPTQYRSLQIS